MRVQILKDYVKQHFPATPLLDYALEVEKITTSKVKEKMALIPTSWLVGALFGGKQEPAHILIVQPKSNQVFWEILFLLHC